MNERRQFLIYAGFIMTCRSAIARAESAPAPQVRLYKSPTCGCCGKWADHMRDAGFDVESNNVQDVVSYKRQYGVPATFFTCHTAIVEGYVIEGHVPADDVIRLLRERPEIKGIGVPGMPIGSPGMEGPNPERYETLSFDAEGNIAVFAVHEP